MPCVCGFLFAKNPHICYTLFVMVIRMRHTHGHTANRRSHHALKAGTFAVCTNCGAKRQPHTVCAACGYYRGRKVVDMVKKVEKKQNKTKAKAGKATK
jgi:large subunit ribosomal protein L32